MRVFHTQEIIVEWSNKNDLNPNHASNSIKRNAKSKNVESTQKSVDEYTSVSTIFVDNFENLCIAIHNF